MDNTDAETAEHPSNSDLSISLLLALRLSRDIPKSVVEGAAYGSKLPQSALSQENPPREYFMKFNLKTVAAVAMVAAIAATPSLAFAKAGDPFAKATTGAASFRESLTQLDRQSVV